VDGPFIRPRAASLQSSLCANPNSPRFSRFHRRATCIRSNPLPKKADPTPKKANPRATHSHRRHGEPTPPQLALPIRPGYAAPHPFMTELALTLGSALLGLAFAAFLARAVLARPAGDPETARAANLVRVAAESFLRRQSSTIGALSAVLGGAIFLAYGLLRTASSSTPVLSAAAASALPAAKAAVASAAAAAANAASDPVAPLELGVWLTISFAIGAALTGAAAQVAAWAATRTTPRAATGARRSLDDALQIAMRGGAVSGLFVTTASLLGQAGLFAAVFAYKGGFGPEPAAALRLAPSIPLMIAGYALGSGFAALLAQLGGGVFAKAADVGADLAARDAGLDEDAAKNPATIADLAGDIVGGAAGRASGLFASTVAENLGALLAGAALFRDNPSIKSSLAVMLMPLVTRGFGVIATLFGVMVVRTDDREDPLSALARGLYVTATLHAVGFAGASKWLLGDHWLAFFFAGIVGVGTGVGLFHLSQYYTDARYRPVREVAETARAGPTLVVLQGLATGIESTVVPFVVVIFAGLASFALGAKTGLASGGLYGMAIATMGMLGTAGYVLTMDAFGPILDVASGVVEMTVADARPDVRGRATVLDAVGNTVKAFTKCYAAGAAALAALLLVSAYLDEVKRRVAQRGLTPEPFSLRLEHPEVAAAALLGVLLVAWVASRCLVGTARPARRLYEEARRQLKDKGEPDHETCVELCARAGLRFMIAPAVVSVCLPIFVGIALRFGRTNDNPLLAADSVAAFVLAGAIAGILGTLLFGHAGGAWDNAKKYIATGAHGGRHLVDEGGARVDNPTYAAALVGDAVGDPLKDTAGPAIHALVKMLPVVTLVFLPFFI
jgi:K(+)-stimulated pyrophosphate-energized sodium pump